MAFGGSRGYVWVAQKSTSQVREHHLLGWLRGLPTLSCPVQSGRGGCRVFLGKVPASHDSVVVTETLHTRTAGSCFANHVLHQMLSSRTVILYSLPPQDMEVCADELKNILNTVVNKREWLTLYVEAGRQEWEVQLPEEISLFSLPPR